MEIVIKIRRIDLAVVASLIAHLLIFSIPLRHLPVETLGGRAEPRAADRMPGTALTRSISAAPR